MTTPTMADPTRYAELRKRIAAQLDAQRHADAERHSEARHAVPILRRCIAERHDHDPSGEAFWTRLTREDRAADYQGQPPTMPGPILASAQSAD